MEKVELKTGNREVVCLPEDGGRIDSLSYKHQQILTSRPDDFKAPEQDYGVYETRPVYGYDDCFPSVDPCRYPGLGIDIPDHGELYRLNWQVHKHYNKLMCSTESRLLPVTFKRQMVFQDNSLIWNFEVINRGGKQLPFIHIMHALMPLDQITGIKLPGFKEIYDEFRDSRSGIGKIEQYLLNLKPPAVEMLLLLKIDNGEVVLEFESGRKLLIEFDETVFPALGIWWNNRAYPDEAGCRRTECAFEPIPGTSSELTRCYEKNTYLTAPSGEMKCWTIKWSIL
jgi:hypothetical protein